MGAMDRSPLMDRVPLFAKLPHDGADRKDLFTHPDPEERKVHRPPEHVFSPGKKSHKPAGGTGGLMPPWMSADTLGGMFLLLLAVCAALQLILFLRAKDRLPHSDAGRHEDHFGGLNHEFLSEFPEEWEEGDAALPSPPPVLERHQLNGELAAQIAEVLTRKSIRVDDSGVIKIQTVQLKQGEVQLEIEKKPEMLPALLDAQEAALQFMADAQELPTERDQEVKAKMVAIVDAYKAARGENVLSGDPTFEAARKDFFAQFLASEELTGALLWMVAHWDLHGIRQDWTEWTEINLGRHATLYTIMQTYQDSMVDPQPVEAITQLIQKFIDNNWRLAVGSTIPENPQEL